MGKHIRIPDGNKRHSRKNREHEEEIEDEEDITTSSEQTPTVDSVVPSLKQTPTVDSVVPSLKQTNDVESVKQPPTKPMIDDDPIEFNDDDYKQNIIDSGKSEVNTIFQFLPGTKEVDMSNFTLNKMEAIAGDETERFKLIQKGRNPTSVVFRLAPGEVLFSTCNGVGDPFNKQDLDKPWKYEKSIRVGPITDETLLQQDPSLTTKYEECRLKMLSVARWIRRQAFDKSYTIRGKCLEKVFQDRPDLIYEGMNDPNVMPPTDVKELGIRELFKSGGTWHHPTDLKKQTPADNPEGSIFRTKSRTFARKKGAPLANRNEKKDGGNEPQTFALAKATDVGPTPMTQNASAKSMYDENGLLIFDADTENKRSDEEVKLLIKKFTADGNLKFVWPLYYKCVRRGQKIETKPIREELGIDEYGREKWQCPNTEVLHRGDVVVLNCYFKITFSPQGFWVTLMYTPNMILRIKERKRDVTTSYCFVSPIIGDE